MKKRSLRFLLAFALSLSILSVSGFAVAHAAVPTPNYIECSSTYWSIWQTRTWYNTDDPNNYDQSLATTLWALRDEHNNAYCGAMAGRATLRYRRFSHSSQLNISMIEWGGPGAEYNSENVGPNTSSTYFTTSVTTFNTPLAVPCGYAYGNWFASGVLNTSVRVPSAGGYCPP